MTMLFRQACRCRQGVCCSCLMPQPRSVSEFRRERLKNIKLPLFVQGSIYLRCLLYLKYVSLVTLAFLNLFVKEIKVSKENRSSKWLFYELCNYLCLHTGQLSQKYFSEENMDGTHLVHFLSTDSSMLSSHCVHSLGHATAFIAVLYVIKVMK